MLVHIQMQTVLGFSYTYGMIFKTIFLIENKLFI